MKRYIKMSIEDLEDVLPDYDLDYGWSEKDTHSEFINVWKLFPGYTVYIIHDYADENPDGRTWEIVDKSGKTVAHGFTDSWDDAVDETRNYLETL